MKGRLLGRVQRIDRRVHPAQHGNGVKHNGVFQTVRTVDSEDIAFPESSAGQAGGHATNGILELGVGQRPAGWPINQRNLVRHLGRKFKDEIGERDFRDGDVWIWSAKDHKGGRDFCLWEATGAQTEKSMPQEALRPRGRCL